MIEELIGKLKSEVGGQLTTKTEVSSDNLDDVFSVFGDVFKKEASREMMGGNFSGLMNLFSDDPNNSEANNIQSNLSSNLVTELIGKLGISPAQAQKIVAIALPVLMNIISKKNSSNTKDDSSFLSDLLGGGNRGGLGGILGGFLK
ncbi:DUF937 domain-containing protein [Aequorivita sp. H23M31]|uniref:DUF937 domain-containing protein n=1 Tax=Aequorivita ciconiae TaxID=2494375 RepID=A0A410G185_9FLAO|nr:DUF937 domain-containing protein [Aequorivita sp. H23M31]QAA81038.1 DUF937 domain-containing protein [Aequorivita sp. H23M31]